MAIPTLKLKKNKNGGVLPNTKPVAVIDIGSNSVRLVVFEGVTLTPIPLFNEKCLCGLGREVASSGKLGEDAVERALMALRRFKSVVDHIGAGEFRVIATAAAREASNGPKFIKDAEAICGRPIEVISGVVEAELAAAGVLAGDHKADGLAGDMGGGSLELIDISNKSLSKGETLPLGGLRLIDIANNDLKDARKFIDETLDQISWLNKGKGRSFYLVGGTWRAFIKLHMEAHSYPLKVLHGYKISPESALEFASHLMKKSDLKDIQGINKISKQRRHVLPFGALVLERLIKKIEPSEIITSNYGVREGLLYSMLSEQDRLEDPLLSACENLAYLRSRSPAHAFELGEWTNSIFETDDLKETTEDTRLRKAACLVSDIGWRMHPSFRAERTMGAIAYSVYSGIDHPGRAFLALSNFFRHNGPNSNGFDTNYSKLLDKDMLYRARIVGGAIRAAHMISAGVPGIIPKTPIFYDEGRLVIELPHPYDALDGERLEKRLRSLGKLLNIETELRVNSDSRFFSFMNF
ncbi:MAG: exopolyphosphatase [Hyphomicrobiales bacterium]